MFRMSPTSLYLCGQSNIGKSHLVIKIIKLLNQRVYHFKDFNKCVFAKTVTTEHWDGYNQQPIVVFDDHYKMQDGKQEIDARETMNSISCTNYFPSFAHLDRKGSPFISEIVIFTANVGWPVTQYIPEALHRRHRHHVIVINNTKPMNPDFSHLDLYYAKNLINPWNGVYSDGFSQQHDIPTTMSEFETFPFRHYYQRVTLIELIDILTSDLSSEKAKFNSIFN